MEFWQRVHWFATSKCNLNCKYCFKPDFQHEDSKEAVEKFAKMLAENGIREVIVTGGEPLLLEHLDDGLRVLADKRIDVSVHTNATLIDKKRLDGLVELVDEIAIPIDSMHRGTQAYLRQSACLSKVKSVLEQLQEKKVRIGIHTVATDINISHMPSIYRFLRNRRFDYWKIYELNRELSNSRSLELDTCPAESFDAGTNCLFAKFLLMADKMAKFKDKRVKFVGTKDYDRTPYFFLNTRGDAYYADWYSQGERTLIGNIFKEGFKSVQDKVKHAKEQCEQFNVERFNQFLQELPLFARLWEGNYWEEEAEEVERPFWARTHKLASIYAKRAAKQLGYRGYLPRKVV